MIAYSVRTNSYYQKQAVKRNEIYLSVLRLPRGVSVKCLGTLFFYKSEIVHYGCNISLYSIKRNNFKIFETLFSYFVMHFTWALPRNMSLGFTYWIVYSNLDHMVVHRIFALGKNINSYKLVFRYNLLIVNLMCIQVCQLYIFISKLFNRCDSMWGKR